VGTVTAATTSSAQAPSSPFVPITSATIATARSTERRSIRSSTSGHPTAHCPVAPGPRTAERRCRNPRPGPDGRAATALWRHPDRAAETSVVVGRAPARRSRHGSAPRASTRTSPTSASAVTTRTRPASRASPAARDVTARAIAARDGRRRLVRESLCRRGRGASDPGLGPSLRRPRVGPRAGSVAGSPAMRRPRP